jgi:hypothetical protein
MNAFVETVAVLDALPELVRAERIRRGLSHRAAGEQIGYAYADLCRFERRTKTLTLPTALAMLRWLEQVDA